MDARDNIISDLSELSSEDIASLIPPTEFTAGANSSSNPSEKSFFNGSSSSTDACKPGNSDHISFTDHKCEGEEDYDCLSPLNDDDTLIYGASNFCIADPFLLSNPQSLFGYEPMKLQGEGSTEEQDHFVQGGGIVLKSVQSTSSNSSNENALVDVSTMPPALSVPVGRARSRRPRLGGAVRTAARGGNRMIWSSSAPYILQSKHKNYSTDANLTDGGTGKRASIPGLVAYCNSFSSGFALGEEIEGNNASHGEGWMRSNHGVHSQCHTCCDDDDDDDDGIAPSKRKKPLKVEEEEEGEEEPIVHRCSHCLSNKTPQWRAGPAGPKTLCNACGVRFKSGRLFDEYRPAKSPTFSSFKHSNSHRKVLEMRLTKGLQLLQPSSDDRSPSSSSSTSFIRTKPRIQLKSSCNGSKKLKFKQHGDRIAPHLPDIVLIDPPTLDTPNFMH